MGYTVTGALVQQTLAYLCIHCLTLICCDGHGVSPGLGCSSACPSERGSPSVSLGVSPGYSELFTVSSKVLLGCREMLEKLSASLTPSLLPGGGSQGPSQLLALVRWE